MSKGLGKRERQILFIFYDDRSTKSLNEFSGSKKTTFYALERLIKKGLVTKHKRKNNTEKRDVWYNVTDEGRKVAGEVFKEAETYVHDRFGMWETGRGKTRARKILSRLQDLQEEHLDYLEGKIAITEPEAPIEHLPGEGIALVDFYAEWCEPCKSMEPVIDELKEEFKDKEVVFVKVDVDKSKKLASKYKANLLPTLLILKDGKVFKKHIGLTNGAILKKELESALPEAINECKDGVCPLPA